jgi:hypothetical protein
MIRASDLSNAATWARPTSVAPRAEARDASSWFEGGSASDARILGDVNPASRGLNVAQHTGLILAQLCGER